MNSTARDLMIAMVALLLPLRFASGAVALEPEERLVKKITTLVGDGGRRVDWCQKNDSIVFSKSGEDGYADLYTMNPDGSNQISLTSGKAGIPQLSNDQPRWHPSGEYIVFEAQDPDLKVPLLVKPMERYLTQGGAGFNNNLWVVTKDGEKFYQLTHIGSREASLHPHFSHDGKKLLWAARELQGRRDGRWMLKLADFLVDDSGPHLANIKNFSPLNEKEAFYESHGFFPDDTKIIFSASRTKIFDMDIYTLDPVTSQLTNLTNTPGEWDEHSVFSPSGKKVIWISSHGYDFSPVANWGATLKTDHWLMNPDGSGKTKLTCFNDPDNDAAFSEYKGKRVIVADTCWNGDGNKLAASMAIFQDGKQETRIVLMELGDKQ